MASALWDDVITISQTSLKISGGRWKKYFWKEISQDAGQGSFFRAASSSFSSCPCPFSWTWLLHHLRAKTRWKSSSSAGRYIVGCERWLTWSFFWGNCHRLEIICCRLCHCFHVLKPRQIIWNWSNRFQAGHAQIVSTSAGSASSAVAKPNSEVFKGFFSCLLPNTDRTGAISRRSITFRRRLSMIRTHTTILKKAIIPWNCRWLCLLQLQWRRAHQDSWKRCEGCQDQGCAH